MPGPFSDNALVKAQITESRLDDFITSQSMGPWVTVGLLNGWVTYASRPLQARLVPALNSVYLAGQITGGTKTDGTQIAGMTPAYSPANRVEDVVVGVNSAVEWQTYLEITTAGAVVLWGLAASGTMVSPAHLTICGMYPLDS